MMWAFILNLQHDCFLSFLMSFNCLKCEKKILQCGHRQRHKVLPLFYTESCFYETFSTHGFDIKKQIEKSDFFMLLLY